MSQFNIKKILKRGEVKTQEKNNEDSIEENMNHNHNNNNIHKNMFHNLMDFDNTTKTTKNTTTTTTNNQDFENENQNLHNEENEDETNQFKNRLNVFCMNCGKKGHLTKKCNYPIISLGIISIYIDNFEIDLNMILSFCKKIQNKYLFENDEILDLKNIYKKIKNVNDNYLNTHIKYLMIRRKNTLSYVDFIRGKYDLDDYEYIYNTILMMTNEEKQNLLTKSFDVLWSDLWACPLNVNNHNQEYEDSKTKFNKLRDGYQIYKCEVLFNINFEKVINSSMVSYNEPEWGFPKGRRNFNEKNIECAKREFQEETGLIERDYHILNFSPLEEIYLGTNHIRYKHIYYFGQMSRYIQIYLWM